MTTMKPLPELDDGPSEEPGSASPSSGDTGSGISGTENQAGDVTSPDSNVSNPNESEDEDMDDASPPGGNEAEASPSPPTENDTDDGIDDADDDTSERPERDDKNEGRKLKGNMWHQLLCDVHEVDMIAPVTNFKHAPFAANWDAIPKRGLFVELPNTYSEHAVNAVYPDIDKYKWWFAKVVGLAGYRAFVRFVKVNEEDKNEQVKFTWVAYFADILRPIGFSAEYGKDLVPVIPSLPVLDKAIIEKIQTSLQSEETLPIDHYETVCVELTAKAGPYRPGKIVEALDKGDCSKYRLAKVVAAVGDRVKVKYDDHDRPVDYAGFWFGQNSPHIHELGWCRAIGISVTNLKAWRIPYNVRIDSNTLPKVPENMSMKKSMPFEMRHPVKPHKLVAGYVVDVLQHGYFIAGTDWSRDRDHERVHIILHVTSDYVLPVNFCRDHDIKWNPPAFKTKPFDWKDCLRAYESTALDVSGVQRPPNLFRVGQKIEAVKVVEPMHVRPATVDKVAGHLLKIHFDGEGEKSKAYQWVSCASSNIFPVGYAEMVCHQVKGEPEKTKTKYYGPRKLPA